MCYRIDRDSLDDIKVPSEAYYIPVRASSQYTVTGERIHEDLI
jgi:aspartate ammonia-lyase